MTRFFVFDTADAARRLVVAISAALGLPRTLTDADVRRIGGTRTPLPRVRAYTNVHEIRRGRLAGKFVVPVDPDALVAFDGTVLAVPATYDGRAVPGGAGTVRLNLAAAELPSSDHDGDERAP